MAATDGYSWLAGHQSNQDHKAVSNVNCGAQIPSTQPQSIDDGKSASDSEEITSDINSCQYVSQLIIFIKFGLLPFSKFNPLPHCFPSEFRKLTLPIDFLSGLWKRMALHEKVRTKQPVDLKVSWKPCSQLRYYKQRSPTAARTSQLTEPHSLNFRDKAFNTSGMPTEIPDNIRNMKMEENRLRSFFLSGKNTFQGTCHFIQPEDMAANGFFYMQTRDKVKCAFCLGVLADWQQGETPVDAHKRHFSTCPFVLGLDVGNISLHKESKGIVPMQCSEVPKDYDNPWITKDFSTYSMKNQQFDESHVSWQSLLEQPLDAQDECAYQIMRRSAFPVSTDVAKAAAKPSIVLNIDILCRGLNWQSAECEYPQAKPEFSEAARRAATFTDDPCVPADQLADAGFYFYSSDCSSYCYWCNLRIQSWSTGDDPWIEHARWSPRCCHLLLSRGYEFVLASRARHPPYLPEFNTRGAYSKTATAVKSSSLNGSVVEYRVEQRHFKARDDLPASLVLKELDFESADIKTAQFMQLKSTGNDFSTDELLLSRVLRIQRERELENIGAAEFNEKKVKEIEDKRNRQPSDLGDNEISWKACKVCMDKVINVTLLDCNHLCCCSLCAKALQTCPVCRADIKALVYINLEG